MGHGGAPPSLRPHAHYKFEYIPCTSVQFDEPGVRGRMPVSISLRQRRNCVGAWKVGKVMDTAVVKNNKQHTLMVDVRIEWIGWRAMKE
eukprot:1881250-Prymnesium_polylepis.1